MNPQIRSLHPSLFPTAIEWWQEFSHFWNIYYSARPHSWPLGCISSDNLTTFSRVGMIIRSILQMRHTELREVKDPISKSHCQGVKKPGSELRGVCLQLLHLLQTYHVPGTVPWSGDTAGNTTRLALRPPWGTVMPPLQEESGLLRTQMTALRTESHTHELIRPSGKPSGMESLSFSSQGRN